MKNSAKKKSIKKWSVIFGLVLGVILINIWIPFMYNPKEYTIAGLRAWCSITEVKKVLGKPLSKSETNGIECWEYPGISLIRISGVDMVEEIILTSDRYQTYRGIKVGDPFEKVKWKYWFVRDKKYFLDLYTLFGHSQGTGLYSIYFNQTGGKVSSISYSCWTN